MLLLHKTTESIWLKLGIDVDSNMLNYHIGHYDFIPPYDCNFGGMWESTNISPESCVVYRLVINECSRNIGVEIKCTIVLVP